MKTARRILGLFLCMLLCVGTVPAATAAESNLQQTDVYGCETTDDWTADGELSLDTEDQTQGEGCISVTLDAVKDSNAILSVRATFESVDVSDVCMFSFDFYISDPTLLTASQIVAVDFGSAGTSDGELITWYEDAFAGIGESGWYRISLPLDAASRRGFRETELNYFCLQFFHVNPAEDLTDVEIKIDNITATIAEYQKVSLDMCDKIAEGDWNGNTVVRDPVNKTQGTASYAMIYSHTPQYGGWSMVCEKKYEPLNVQNAVYIEMDVYIADIERLHNSHYGDKGIHFEITSSGTCDWNEYCWLLNDYIFENGWTHVRLPISEAVTPGAGRGAPDMSAINYIRFHVLGVRGDEQPVNFAVDNIYFSAPVSSDALTLGATPIDRQEQSPTDPALPDPNQPLPDTGSGTESDDSALRARKTEQRAKILVLLMVFAVVGVDAVAVAVKRKNEQDEALAAAGIDEQPPTGEA